MQLRMADGYGERIGRMVGCGRMVKCQQCPDHILNLSLIRCANANYYLLDLSRRIFPYRELLHRDRHKRSTPCLPGGQRTFRIRTEIDRLDSYLGRMIALYHSSYSIVYLPETLGYFHLRLGCDAAVCQGAPLRTTLFDDTPAGVGKSGIYPEYDDGFTCPHASATSLSWPL
jgi:hypothetical protein